MGFGFGFRFGLGSGGASAPSPPTALTLTLPAISDETVDCTATFSADAEKWTVVPHGDPAPVYGVGTWTNVGETHIHTTALSGAIELDAYGWSAAGGVSVTPATDSTIVAQSAWTVPGCLGYWGVAPWGVVAGSNPITQINDVQPAGSYPVSKTGPYHRSVTNLTLSGGEIVGAGTANTTDAELVATFFTSDDAGFAFMYVGKETAYPGGLNGPLAVSLTGQARSIIQDGQVQTFATDASGLPYHSVNTSNAIDTSTHHVYLYVYYGGAISLYTELGTVIDSQQLHLNAMTGASDQWVLSAGSQVLELARWGRGDLSAAERLRIITGAANRHSLPFFDGLLYDEGYAPVLRANGLADDSVLRVTDLDAAESIRALLWRHLWGVDCTAIPTDRLPAVTTDVVCPMTGLSSLARTDQLDGYVNAYTAGGAVPQHSQAWHLVPEAPIGKAAYLCNGHSDTDVTVLGLPAMAQALLSLGWDVFVYLMPRDPWVHATIFSLVLADYRAFEIFFEPPLLCLNYAIGLGLDGHTAIGISGGGWTSTVWAAIDPRVVRSFGICGSLPLYMRAGYSLGDTEQTSHEFFAHAGWLDIYALSATHRQSWLCYVLDDIYFGPAAYDESIHPRLAGLDWAGAVADYVGEVDAVATYALGGGRVQTLIASSGGHTITEWLRNQIIARLP